ALLHQQLCDVVARRAVIAHQLVDKRFAVTVAVTVHVAESVVDPHVAGAGIPAEHEVLRGGRAAGGGKRGGEQQRGGAVHGVGSCRREEGPRRERVLQRRLARLRDGPPPTLRSMATRPHPLEASPAGDARLRRLCWLAIAFALLLGAYVATLAWAT